VLTAALAAFAQDEGIHAMHRAVLVRDGAGGHTSGKLAVPEGIDLVCLHPVERVWSLVDEPVANRTLADLDALADVLVTRCQTLRTARRIIKANTRYQWWARERRPRNPK